MKNLILCLLLFPFLSFGQSWQDVGGGTNSSSHGLLVYNNELINLGSYNNPCQKVASWDGTNWNCLGGGVGLVGRAGTVWNGNLVVVGDFWNNFQPCVGCNGIAVWDGTSWNALDQGFNNDVLTVTVWNGELIVGGDFTQANGVPCSRVVRWDVATSTFISMGAPTDFDNDVRCMTEYNGDLWVGGDFNNVGGCSPCDGLVKWNDATQTWEGGNSGVDLIGGVNETVRVLYVNPNDGNLYMGGEFPELHDGDAASQNFDMGGIAMYDGSNWFSLGTGLNEYCRAIHEYNGNLIAGGYFTSAGGVSANKIAKWNPLTSTWSAMGQGFDGVGLDEYVKSAMVWNGTFFAGGAYTQAEGGPMNYVAQWYEPIVSPPVAGFTASNSSICAGDCINFTDLSSNSPNGWTWQFPGASTSTSTAQNPSNICFPNAGTFTIQLTACNGNGCDVFTSDIVVTDSPTLTINNETICEGQSANLVANASVSGGDYSWTPNGEITSSIIVTPTSSTSYSVDYILNGCSSNTAVALVTVNPTPTVTVADETICQGNTINLIANPSTSGGNYAWNPNGETSQIISVSPNSTTSYSVIYSLNGCPSIEQYATVNVNPSYSTNESISACIGEIVVYPDMSSEVISANTSHTSNLQTVELCDSIILTIVTAIADYELIQDIDICSGSDYTYADGTNSINIMSNESHTSSFTGSEGCDSIITTNLIVMPSPDNLVSESGSALTANQNGANYQWLDCDNSYAVIVGETGQTYNATNNGSYAVEIDLNGCIDTSGCLLIEGLEIVDDLDLIISIYPNPVQDNLIIKSNELASILVQVTDIQGKIVLSQSIDKGENQINLNEFDSGIYLVHFSINQKRYVRRITKQ